MNICIKEVNMRLYSGKIFSAQKTAVFDIQTKWPNCEQFIDKIFPFPYNESETHLIECEGN